MGAILAMLRHGDLPGNGIYVDLQKADPTPPEAPLYQTITTLLSHAPQLIASLRTYVGCDDAIRAAISTPSAVTEQAAWNAVLPAVRSLKQFYDYAVDIERVLPRMLDMLCDGPDVSRNLEKRQATAKGFADVIHFASEFDDLKMVNPSIQNDFSYYRRTLSRLKSVQQTTDIEVNDDLANRMSLFFAYPTPMLKLITDTTVNYVSARGITSKVNECLAIMANICHNAVLNGSSEADGLFCLRVMTACIILYDHIHEAGAFSKSSAINVKASIRLIQTSGSENQQALLNSLRYTTKHLNDSDTPRQVKLMLGAT